MSTMPIFETTVLVATMLSGFICLIAVLLLIRGSLSTDQKFSLQILVSGSLPQIFYANTPLILSTMGFEGQTLWRVSSGIFLVTGTILSAIIYPATTNLPGAMKYRVAYLAAWVLITLAVVVHIVNVSALGQGPGQGLYLLGIWFVLGGMVTILIDLLFRTVTVDIP